MKTRAETRRGGRLGRVAALLAGAGLAVLVWAAPAAAQVRVGVFTGAYDRGAGAHPRMFLAVGGRLGLEVLGPLTLEGEAMHVPAKVAGRDVDLFAYRGNLVVGARQGDIRPFALVGAGYQQWRRWVCGGASCASQGGPGQKFEYFKGAGFTAGAGARFRTSGPFWFRVDARFEHGAFKAPTTSDWAGTMGVELRL